MTSSYQVSTLASSVRRGSEPRRRRRRAQGLVWLACVLAAAGCSRTPPATCAQDQAPPAVSARAAGDKEDHPEPPEASNDLARMRSLERGATKLIAEGKTTPTAELIKQLARKQCTLKLPAPTGEKFTPGRIYARYVDSVLVVAGVYKCGRCKRWHAGGATGFLISASGAFVTNYHVVGAKAKETIVAMTHDGKVYPVKEVLAANQADDVAILRLDAGAAELKPVPLSADAPVGTPVSVISHPDRRFYALTHGIVSRYAQRRRGRTTVTMMTVTADFARGSSGGPVIDDRGAAVGLVSSTSSVYYTKKENLQMVFKQCVPAGSILKLIKK